MKGDQPIAASVIEKPACAIDTTLVARLRALAISGLTRMYRPDERLFVFRVRRDGQRVVSEGLSRRYTAIALIGLAQEADATVAGVLGGHHVHDVCGRLIGDVPHVENLGDVALITWAARAVNYPDRRWAWERLVELVSKSHRDAVVEVAWTLAALCIDAEAPVDDLRQKVARRLIASFQRKSAMFPHVIGGTGLRSHVSCFADLVYPIHALARYFMLSGDREALAVAARCGAHVAAQQGSAGQWWWHYDGRTGKIIERYPVYAVHQDAMAPMALFALQEASGTDFTPQIGRGLSWLANAPELRGGSLVDDAAELIWRKVARREPGKLSRAVQAATSRAHSALRVPGLNALFPPRAVDYEDRPYHLGWLLYAWPAARYGHVASLARSSHDVQAPAGIASFAPTSDGSDVQSRSSAG